MFTCAVVYVLDNVWGNEGDGDGSTVMLEERRSMLVCGKYTLSFNKI